MDFEILLRSLRGHKGVKGQIYKDAPIELKFQYNDPYDILSILKYFKIHSRSLRGHKGVKGQIFKNAPIELRFINNDPCDILSILNGF